MPRVLTGRPRGRPPGSKTKSAAARNQRIIEARDKALEGLLSVDEIEVLTPLDALLHLLRAAWKIGDFASVKEIAVHAAPYLHARLSSTQLDANVSLLDKIPRDQQRALIEALAIIPEGAGDAEAGAGASVN